MKRRVLNGTLLLVIECTSITGFVSGLILQIVWGQCVRTMTGLLASWSAIHILETMTWPLLQSSQIFGLMQAPGYQFENWAKGHFRHTPRAVTMKLWEPQRKVSKGRPKTPPKSCGVVMDSRVQCEVIRDRGLDQMLFRWISIHVGPHTWSNKKINWLCNMVSQWFCVRPTSKRWILKIVQVPWTHEPFDAM